MSRFTTKIIVATMLALIAFTTSGCIETPMEQIISSGMPY